MAADGEIEAPPLGHDRFHLVPAPGVVDVAAIPLPAIVRWRILDIQHGADQLGRKGTGCTAHVDDPVPGVVPFLGAQKVDQLRASDGSRGALDVGQQRGRGLEIAGRCGRCCSA